MTNREMTELFSVMLLAWPNAEVFRGGVEKLGPTIKLWASCTADIDFWTGQQAVYRLCKCCKFPPTIADFREQAERISAEIRVLTAETQYTLCCENPEEIAPPGSFAGAVMEVMGGPNALLVTRGQTTMWNLEGIASACQTVIRQRPSLIGGKPVIDTGKKKR